MPNLDSVVQHPLAPWLHNFPSNSQVLVLVANVSQTITVPSNAFAMTMSSNGVFYMKLGSTAAVPTVSDTSTGTAPQINPSAYTVNQAQQYSFVSPTACIVTIGFWGS